MRHATTRVIVGTVVVTATALVLPVTADASNGSDRPLKARGSASGIFNTETESFDIDGTSIGTHVGKSTAHIIGNTSESTGTSTITAANGDMLIFEVDGPSTELDSSACPADLPVASQQPSAIHGGTGRFAAATGHVISTICAGFGDTEPNVMLTVAFTTVGTISY